MGLGPSSVKHFAGGRGNPNRKGREYLKEKVRLSLKRNSLLNWRGRSKISSIFVDKQDKLCTGFLFQKAGLNGMTENDGNTSCNTEIHLSYKACQRAFKVNVNEK